MRPLTPESPLWYLLHSQHLRQVPSQQLQLKIMELIRRKVKMMETKREVTLNSLK